jgi:glycosyltransferase involved in cell wall biosynthesis
MAKNVSFSCQEEGEKDMTKVSVIIPTYNRAGLVTKTIESVLAQSFRDFEIIVIDDGSTDNTTEVLSAYPVKYIKQPNQGPGAARNTGIGLSTGEYIAFLDSDDAYFKHTLAKSVAILDSHPGVGISYGRIFATNENGDIIDMEPKSKTSCIRPGWEELGNYLRTGYHVTMSTVLVRRSLLEEVGGFKAAFRAGSEDLDLWIRLSKKCEVAYIAEPLAQWGPLSRGFSAKRSLHDWETANSSIIDSICNDKELGPHLHQLKSLAYFRLFSNMANRACRRNEMKTARDYLFRAAKVHPQSLFGRPGINWTVFFFRTWIPRPVTAMVSRVNHYLIRTRHNRIRNNFV